MGLEQFMPNIEAENELIKNTMEVIDKLPQQKMEEAKQKMDQTGMAVMHAGMRMQHVLTRRMLH